VNAKWIRSSENSIELKELNSSRPQLQLQCLSMGKSRHCSGAANEANDWHYANLLHCHIEK